MYAHANSLHSAYSNVAGGNTLGLTEIRDEERINIFPNPANNVINFTELTRNSKANLFDINGKLCMSLLLKKGTSQIDISELSKGNYLLQITDDKSAARKSVFIKN